MDTNTYNTEMLRNLADQKTYRLSVVGQFIDQARELNNKDAIGPLTSLAMQARDDPNYGADPEVYGTRLSANAALTSLGATDAIDALNDQDSQYRIQEMRVVFSRSATGRSMMKPEALQAGLQDRLNAGEDLSPGEYDAATQGRDHPGFLYLLMSESGALLPQDQFEMAMEVKRMRGDDFSIAEELALMDPNNPKDQVDLIAFGASLKKAGSGSAPGIEAMLDRVAHAMGDRYPQVYAQFYAAQSTRGPI